jgi:hypothetical protein
MFPFWSSLRERLLDERFVLHRYQSTSHAGIAVALALAGWFLYDQVTRGRIRWDFLVLLGLMVAVKLGFMAWYTLRD